MFVPQHGALFPGFRRDKAAPQAAGLQQLVFAWTSMLVMVCGYGCRKRPWRDDSKNYLISLDWA
jgi:hypothetical protein